MTRPGQAADAPRRPPAAPAPSGPHDPSRARHEEARREALLRAARIGVIRSRREARGPFVGQYASAFRSGGMVFEESRPYVPGEDVRRMDWNAMARTGQPWVKQYREERDRAVSILLDTSGSMAFASHGPSLAERGARVAALLVAVATRAGDGVRVLASTDAPGAPPPVARGAARAWRAVEAIAQAVGRPGGHAGYESLVARAAQDIRPDAIVFVVSDFRPAGGDPTGAPARPVALARLAARSDVVAIVLEDPIARALPDVGRIRIADPERPMHTRVLDTGDATVRARHAEAAAERDRALEHALRGCGCDVLRLAARSEPLHALAHFFRERAARGGAPRP